MTLLGSGWQYSAYDLGNDRVLKKFHSKPKAFWVILKTIFPFQKDPVWKIWSYVKASRTKAETSFKIVAEKKIPHEWLANPKFLKDLDFEQDKVTPLHNVLDTVNVATGKKIVDQFIEFNLGLLSYGVIDKSFSITKNYGLSKENKIVLLDFGELFDSKEAISKQRGKRAWTAHYVVDCINSGEVREYFIKEMDKNFSQ